MEKETTVVQIRLPKELLEKAKNDAAKLGLNFSAYIRYLIMTKNN